MKTTIQINKKIINLLKKLVIEKDTTITGYLSIIIDKFKNDAKNEIDTNNMKIRNILSIKNSSMNFDIDNSIKDFCKLNNLKIREIVIVSIVLALKENDLIGVENEL